MSKTYSQLMKQIDNLQREAEEIKRKEIDGVVTRIKEAIKAYGLTAADLGLTARAPKTAKPGKKRQEREAAEAEVAQKAKEAAEADAAAAAEAAAAPAEETPAEAPAEEATA